MRTTISAITGCAVLLAASTAFAQDQFATQGTLALSADRLFGLAITSNKTEDNQGFTDTVSTTNFTLMGANGRLSGIGGPIPGLNTYAIPRLGIDYFVIDGLSLGGSFLFLMSSGDLESEGPGQPTVKDDLASTTAFAIMPRIGYGVMFDENIGIWPRAGITYYHVSAEDEEIDPATNIATKTEFTDAGTAFTIEVPFVLAPIPHVALTVGPTIEIPLGGTSEATVSSGGVSVSNEVDHTIFEFGIHVGLLGWI